LLEFPLVAFAKKRNAIEYLHLCISALLAENPHGLSSCFKKKGKRKPGRSLLKIRYTKTL
jgi:hypothetical protein